MEWYLRSLENRTVVQRMDVIFDCRVFTKNEVITRIEPDIPEITGYYLWIREKLVWGEELVVEEEYKVGACDETRSREIR